MNPIDDFRSELAAPIYCVESSDKSNDNSAVHTQHVARKRSPPDGTAIWHAQMKQHLPDCLILLNWPDGKIETIDTDAETLAGILGLQAQTTAGGPRLTLHDDGGGTSALCYLKVDARSTGTSATAAEATAMEHWPVEHSIMPGIREHRVKLDTPVPLARSNRPKVQTLQDRQRFLRFSVDGAVHLSGIGGPTMAGKAAPKDIQTWRLRDEDRSMDQVLSPGWCFTVDTRRRRLVHGQVYLILVENRFRVRRWKGDRSPKGWASWSSLPDAYPLLGIQGRRDVENDIIGQVVEVHADLDRSRRSVGAPPFQLPSID